MKSKLDLLRPNQHQLYIPILDLSNQKLELYLGFPRANTRNDHANVLKFPDHRIALIGSSYGRNVNNLGVGTLTLLRDDNTARIRDESPLQLNDVILSTVVNIVLKGIV